MIDTPTQAPSLTHPAPVVTLYPDAIAAFLAASPAGPPPAPPHLPDLRYEQDKDGRYLVTDAGILATLTGVTGLEAQRVGQELAAAPALLGAIGFAVDHLADVVGALAALGHDVRLVEEIRATLIAALARAGRPTQR